MTPAEETIIASIGVCFAIVVCACVCVKRHKRQLKSISSETSLRTMVEEI